MNGALIFLLLLALMLTGMPVSISLGLTVLTFLGGFASVVFVPLATVLVAGQGWRTALHAEDMKQFFGYVFKR